MQNAKIEPRLAEEIEYRGGAAPERGIPVVIENANVVDVPTAGDPQARMRELDWRASASLEAITDHLREIGVTDEVRQLTLSNAVSARLSPRQIEEITNFGDVKFVRLDREDKVTT